MKFQAKSKQAKIEELGERFGFYADGIKFQKDGNIKAGWSFFYTHGKTADDYESKVISKIPNAHIVESGTVWKNFRGGDTTFQGSHFYVVFNVKEE